MSNTAAVPSASDPKVVKEAVKEVRKAIKDLSPEQRAAVEIKVFTKKIRSPSGPNGFTQAMTIAGGGIAAGLAALTVSPSEATSAKAAMAIIGASVGVAIAAVANRKEKEKAGEKMPAHQFPDV